MDVVCIKESPKYSFKLNNTYRVRKIDYQTKINPMNPLLQFELEDMDTLVSIPLRCNMFELNRLGVL